MTEVDETVLKVTSKGSRGGDVYHLSRDCPRLDDRATFRAVPKASLWDDTRPCRYCGEVSDS